MNFRKYQTATATTAVYDESVRQHVATATHADKLKMLRLFYCATKLNGEAGEVAEEIAKTLRDDSGEISTERSGKLAKEIGDVLWYVSQLATELDMDLSLIAQMNLDKLASRKDRGMIHGSGSDR